MQEVSITKVFPTMVEFEFLEIVGKAKFTKIESIKVGELGTLTCRSNSAL